MQMLPYFRELQYVPLNAGPGAYRLLGGREKGLSVALHVMRQGTSDFFEYQ